MVYKQKFYQYLNSTVFCLFLLPWYLHPVKEALERRLRITCKNLQCSLCHDPSILVPSDLVDPRAASLWNVDGRSTVSFK